MQYTKLAALYDGFMSGVDHCAWASYLAGFLPPGAKVLECACGTGLISVPLAKLGFDVTASDISQDMLICASKKQRDMGLSNLKLRFVAMDMRELSHHKKVDAVISCCDGVNYLTSREDVLRFFSAAASVLKPGGLLLFDISSRYKLSHILDCNSFVDNGEEAAYLWKNEYDPGSKLIRMELSFFKKQPDGLYERFDETHFQRAHSIRELGNRLKESGFGFEIYSFGTLLPPKEEDERIQFVARKL